MGFTLRAGDPLGKALQAFQLTTSIADAADEREKKKALGEVGEVTSGSDFSDEQKQAAIKVVNDSGGTEEEKSSAIKAINAPAFFGGKTYNSQDAAGASQLAAQQGIYRKFGDTKGANELGRDAQNMALTGLQMDEARSRQKQTKLRDEADADVAKWVSESTKKDDKGNVTQAPSFVDIGKYRRDSYVKRGMMNEAMGAHQEMTKSFIQDWEMNKAQREQQVANAFSAAEKGDYEPASKLYDLIPDGYSVKDIKKGAAGPDGRVPLFAQVTGDQGGVTQQQFIGYQDDVLKHIQSARDPRSFVERIDKEFAQRIQSQQAENDKKRTDASVAASQASAGLTKAQTAQIEQKTTDARDLASIRAEIEEAITKGDTAAEKAGRSKLSMYIRQGRGTGNDMTAQEKIANAYMAANPGLTYAQALERAGEKKTMSAKDFHAETVRDLMKARMMNASDADKEAQAATALVYGKDWKNGGVPGAAPAPVPAKGELKVGQVYDIPGRGKMKWTEAGFVKP
jgi:hypothetical protein